MMQASLQAPSQVAALIPPPQHMHRQQAPPYHPLPLMPAQYTQSSVQNDGSSMQRQILAWQNRAATGPWLLQLPYTSHNNPVAQQGMYSNDQVLACQLSVL